MKEVWQKYKFEFAVFFFVYALLSFVGANFYQDFYFEMKSRYGGQSIDLSRLSEFCGWTGSPYPWESDFDYRLRSAKNMFGALCAMLVISATVLSVFMGSLFGLFYASGGFQEK